MSYLIYSKAINQVLSSSQNLTDELFTFPKLVKTVRKYIQRNTNENFSHYYFRLVLYDMIGTNNIKMCAVDDEYRYISAELCSVLIATKTLSNLSN